MYISGTLDTILEVSEMPDVNDIDNWTHDDIREFYDLNPNLSILTYAGMLGLTGGELKDILMGEV